jgi:MOSC domain-containing protein YiiM
MPHLASTGTLLSIHVGKPRAMLMSSPVDGRPLHWTSGIFKSPVTGTVRVEHAPLPGDGQADPENHGGPDNIILAYDADHYPHWRTRLNLPDLSPGSFGENFSVTGISDDSACIGDIWHVGTTPDPATPPLTLQITQPRQPCFKLARRLSRPDIVKLVHETSWGGWYLRVLNPGPAHAGMPITRVERPHPDWPVARAVQVMYNRKIATAPASQLAAIAELSARWKDELIQ